MNARSLTLTPFIGMGEQNTACLNLSLNSLIFESVLLVSCHSVVTELGLKTVRLVLRTFRFEFVIVVKFRIVETTRVYQV